MVTIGYADSSRRSLPDRRGDSVLQGVYRVGGIDEAGVGALAGPVVAAVCILPRNATVETLAIEGINDSKKLSPKKREIVFEQLLKHPGVRGMWSGRSCAS